MVLTVLELFSGVGGMHVALKTSQIDFEVKLAVDINANANEVYKLNFPNTALRQGNIEQLNVQEFDLLEINTILMSPPCQPFSRVGQKLDLKDSRCKAFLHILDLLDRSSCKPEYILLENVKGFEDSGAHVKLIEVLHKCNYLTQEYLITPTQLGIPNSRLRYYLLAKHRGQRRHTVASSDSSSKCSLCSFLFSRHLSSSVKSPSSTPTELDVSGSNVDVISCPSANHTCLGEDGRTSLEEFLERDIITSDYLLPLDTLHAYGKAIDIVSYTSCRSCCFTKSYGKYIKGTGSLLQTSNVEYDLNEMNKLKLLDEEQSLQVKLQELKLRYFTPREVANLMLFPSDFQFPKTLTNRQMYQLLGNSVNCYVISILIKILLEM